MEKYSLLKEYIQKQVKSLLKEEVYGNKAIVYHRTSLNIEELNNIFFNKKWSFGINTAILLGKGLYTTYSLKSQMNKNMVLSYGKNIIKFSVNLKNFLICDYEEFQKTPQYQRLNKPKEKDKKGNLIFIIEQLKEKNIIIKELYNKNKESFNTIFHLIHEFPKIKLLFDGIMYTGELDGKCCVVFSSSIYNTSIPLGYYTPKKDSPKSINDYEYISSFNKDSNFKNFVNDKLNNNLNNKNVTKNDYINFYFNNEIRFKDIPEKFKDYSFCEKVVSQNGRALEYVPKKIIDYSLCKLAVSDNGLALRYVPEHLRDYSLCEIAVSKDKNNIIYINDPEIKKQIQDKFNLNEYIQKQVKSLLKEAVTDEVYHFTTLSNIINILKQDIFYLSYDYDINKYGMSLSRTKSSKTGFLAVDSPIKHDSFSYDEDYIVRLKLDGRKLSQNYKSKPYNYFNNFNNTSMNKIRSHEYEDRVLSNKSQIQNFSKYIIQIDIKHINNYYQQEEGGNVQEIIDELQTLCNQRNIKLNIVNPNKMDKNYLEEETQPLKKELSQEQIIKNLDKIYSKFENLSFNTDNYSIGGGLSDDKYVSRRQEDAKNDKGKLTLGQATQLFKKATGEDSEIIKLLIQNYFPNIEWHHAGFIPGRKTMNKTYFLNAKEISELAKDFFKIKEKANKQKVNLNTKQSKQEIESYLKDNATYIERKTKEQLPKNLFYITKEEMNGKFGWFKAQDKYSMTIYYSGYKFNSQEEYQVFKNKFNI